MQESFYFDGTQIKNYIIGFASIFSEIPYKNRKGVLESVPIHYGSPSDIISHLEMNVDNDDTTNRNRIKDIAIPLFSFRMTSMERNVEKRRAPHDTIAVDLRPLGYSTGYVAMRPAPVKFTMELILWASSDYQSFEVIEQIVPYFNSPQQVTIEPLPRCPVSTTEVYLESIEIDTEPESQKYSALATMSFSVTGWLLSQPRIWSTNLKFELSMLDSKTQIDNMDANDYSFGHDITDFNTLDTRKIISSISTFDDFVKKTPLVKEYGDKLDWFNKLVASTRLTYDMNIIDTTPLTFIYKGTPKTLTLDDMHYIISEIKQLQFLYTNDLLVYYFIFCIFFNVIFFFRNFLSMYFIHHFI